MLLFLCIVRSARQHLGDDATFEAFKAVAIREEHLLTENRSLLSSEKSAFLSIYGGESNFSSRDKKSSFPKIHNKSNFSENHKGTSREFTKPKSAKSKDDSGCFYCHDPSHMIADYVKRKNAEKAREEARKSKKDAGNGVLRKSRLRRRNRSTVKVTATLVGKKRSVNLIEKRIGPRKCLPLPRLVPRPRLLPIASRCILIVTRLMMKPLQE